MHEMRLSVQQDYGGAQVAPRNTSMSSKLRMQDIVIPSFVITVLYAYSFFFFANSGFLVGFDLCLKDKHVETNIILSFTSFWQCGKRNRALSAFPRGVKCYA